VATVIANGIRLNYERTGDGPDVVLVHGLAANLAFWYLRSVPFLRKEFRVTAYDLRGHGRSETAASGYTPAAMADDLHALLDQLGIDQVHLVGHSFGGVVALEYALRAPERVRSLTIADSRIQAFQPPQRLRDWPHFEAWKRQLERSGLPVPDADDVADYHILARERLAEERSGRPDEAASPAFVPFLGGERRVGKRWLRLLESTTAKEDFRDPGPPLGLVRQLRPPTLAMFGEMSHCLPSCRGLQGAVGCRAVIIPRAGHFFPVTRPRAFAASFRAFVLRSDEYEAEKTIEVGGADAGRPV